MSTSLLAPADYLISARGLMEYRGMFRLSDDELTTKTILDCPGGAASFAAEVRRRGGSVVSVDPAYARPVAELVAKARADVVRSSETSAEHPHLFSWTFFRSVAHHRQVRHDACEQFVDDYTGFTSDEGPHWYLPAALPRLPFNDGSFDLVLSSHLLFTYDHLLDLDTTIAALLELARVARGEVRVFPLVSAGGGRSVHVEPATAALAALGVRSRIERVWYEAQKGGNELLRIVVDR